MLIFYDYCIRGAGCLAGAAGYALVLLGDDNCVSLFLEDAHRAGVHARLAGRASVLINRHTWHIFYHLLDSSDISTI
jgi:hypothetical protein